MRRLLPPLVLVSLLVGIPALADAGDPAGAHTAPSDPPPVTEARSLGELDNAQPTPLDPIHAVHATAFPLAKIGLWVQARDFFLTRGAALYDVEGGAALRLERGIHLTASYRLLGLDRGNASDLESATAQSGTAGFLGLSFDF